MPYVVTEACILCGACVTGCESNAITEGETQSHIDVTICIECGTCIRNCPPRRLSGWMMPRPPARPLRQPPNLRLIRRTLLNRPWPRQEKTQEKVPKRIALFETFLSADNGA